MYGDTLRKVRESQGLTQEALAEKVVELLGCKLSRQAVQRWENDDGYPGSDKWDALDSALGQVKNWTMGQVLKSKAAKKAQNRNTASNNHLESGNFNQAGSINTQDCGSVSVQCDEYIQASTTSRFKTIPMDKNHAEIVERMLDLFSFSDWAELSKKLDRMESGE